MRLGGFNQAGSRIRVLASAIVLLVSTQFSFAQTPSSALVSPASEGPAPPPLDVAASRLPAKDPNAISIEGWRLYPTLRVYSLYSDNLFFGTSPRTSAGGFGVTPGIVAEWTNGIHTTTLYGNLDRQTYPTNNPIDTLDGRAGFTQRYEALRDLIFTFNGNFAHQTWATGLQSSIQTAPASPVSQVLPNGDTLLPNGTIISPTGQVTGQATAGGSNVPLNVNPYNQYTTTLSVDKIFNRGILSLSGSSNRTDYEVQTALSTRSRTYTENAAFWLGPAVFAYSNGSFGTVTTDATSVSTTSYRAIGGFGTDQISLFRGSIYFGHQGSEGGGSSASGDVYGGTIAYYPSQKLTLTGAFDRTINIAGTGAASNLALALPGLTAVQVPLSASTRISSATLQASYEISQTWFTIWQIGQTWIDYVGSTRRDRSLIFDAQLRYDIWRDMSITWEYRYRSVDSTFPAVSTTSNTATVGATYRF
ncbi:outer membrane beta-barrel protein [Bradyrhizobium sp. HKCCYLS1011]|uniref:outer membrane beta-barrel protein n=1 Tax=Bradyrhizobium sp. HKCCYLS1011 TaxID=3420733 RepID=UPI003EBC2B84